MTKNLNLKTEEPQTKRRKHRKLTKAEEEEYTREMNRLWASIREGIEKGEIVLPGWRRNP